MSRRKQSNPRQIKRSVDDMEAGEEAQAGASPLPEQESAASEPPASGEAEPPCPSGPDAPPPPPSPTSPEGPEEAEGPEPRRDEEASDSWSGPDELELALQDGQRCVRARRGLAQGLSWGPFPGDIRSRASSPGPAEPGPAVTLLLEDEACWLQTLPQALSEAEANAEIHRKDGAVWCSLIKPVPAGALLSVLLVAEPLNTPSHPVKTEPAESKSPAPPHPDIQLLPQQAGMASILATAVINKDVFPCKDCGIWYRSERNLQAHLLYYCASRQGAGTPAAATADEKPKETYPHERVCPFPQCRKSCPSASSLEIHMRSHSGERPFVCLICLSAFTTKANCERHLKVHTDTLSGVCHSCGFISTTRDILYSHLVTSHMVCQPGTKAELYSPGLGHPVAKLPPDGLAGFPQQAALQAPAASPAPDGRAPAEAADGEAGAGAQNGGGSEPPAAAGGVKVEAEEPEAAAEPPAPSRTPSPRSPAAPRVKAELCSPTPGASPGPGELGLAAGPLFVPQFVLDAAAAAAPPAAEILAQMSELAQGRGRAGAGAPAGLLAGAAGATCFECDITFSRVSNFYAHKRLYCSGRRAPGDAPAAAPARRPRAAPAPAAPAPAPAAPPAAPSPGPGPGPGPGAGAREEDAGGAGAAEAEAAGRGSEGSASPGSGADDDDDPRRTLCAACNIRFSRRETYAVHKRFYCASRHDPPPRRAPPAGAPGAPPAPAPRARRRRRLHELPAAGPAPAAAGHAPPAAAGHAPPAAAGHAPPAAAGHAPPAAAGHAPAPPASPAPAGPGPGPDGAADGPIDLSKKPRRLGPDAPAPGLAALADYHECTACRVSFHSLEAYLAHKKFACPAAPRLRAAPEDAPVACPYCPPNGLARGDLVEHLRRAHGLRVAEARAPSPAAPRDSPGPERGEPAAPDGSPRPGAPPSPAPSDKGAPPPAPNGSHRFCRLCNIRFSSLSTFIAHKKYYCSSHAAEHVK